MTMVQVERQGSYDTAQKYDAVGWPKGSLLLCHAKTVREMKLIRVNGGIQGSYILT